MKSFIISSIVMLAIFMSACNCEEIPCRSMKPINVNFDGYTESDQMGMIMERYVKGSNFTQKVSESYIDLFYTSQFAQVPKEGQINLYPNDQDSPENYDIKLILIADSSFVTITNLERLLTTRRSCGLIQNQDLVLGIDDCPIGYMSLQGAKVKFKENGVLLWTK